MRIFLVFLLIIVGGSISYALPSKHEKPVVIEPERSRVGSDFQILNDRKTKYVTIKTTQGGWSPLSGTRIVTMSVEFPAPGTYNLYVRLRVGDEQFNDDSFFYANGFGIKDPGNGDDWILANNLAANGYKANDSDEAIVGSGIAGHNVWKWQNLSMFDSDEPAIQFTVSGDELVKIFQIGGRGGPDRQRADQL